jgi:hypothetical protein
MRWFLLSICFLGCVLNLPAQTVHFDNPHNFNRYDYALCSGVVAYRIGDYITTEHALAHGGRETMLPSALVNCKPGFLAYSVGMAALEISGSVYLHRHHHKTLARIVDSVCVGDGAATDIRNTRY